MRRDIVLSREVFRSIQVNTAIVSFHRYIAIGRCGLREKSLHFAIVGTEFYIAGYVFGVDTSIVCLKEGCTGYFFNDNFAVMGCAGDLAGKI